MKNRIRIRDLLLGIAGFLFVTGLAVTLTLNFRPLYYLDMKFQNLTEVSGYSEDLIRTNFNILIDYNNITGPSELVFEGLSMSEHGRIHFEEVKRIFVGIEWMTIVCGILYLTSAICLMVRGKRNFLKTSSACCFLIPAILGLLIASSWEQVFITFHKLVFRNDYWLFDPSEDPVIMILSDAYFMHCAIMILGIIIGAGILEWFLWKKKSRRGKGIA